MITHTQYALLVGVPTACMVLAIAFQYWSLRHFARVMHRNFDRLEQSMILATDNYVRATNSIERRK